MKNMSTEVIVRLATDARNPVKDLTEALMLMRLKFGLSSERCSFNHNTNDSKVEVRKILNRLQSLGYTTCSVHNSLEHLCILEDPTNDCIQACVLIVRSERIVSVTCGGDLTTIEMFRQWLVDEFKSNGSIIRTITDVDERGVVLMDSTFIESEKIQLARQVFYPYINVPLADYFDAFMKSSENVLVLFGPPGTGKSTFLRSLIAKDNYQAYLAYNKAAVEHPAVVRRFYNSSAHILAYEDIDKHLGSRENGNTLMSTFLNASEGVVKQTGKKVVFSTNLSSIDKIDPALLRKGRCFDIIKFDLLTVEEAREVEQEMCLPPADLSGKDKWSLSEVLNPPDPMQQTINRYARGAGFH